MNNIICERLIPLKEQLQAEANYAQNIITRVMTTVINAYAKVIDTATVEEVQTLSLIKNDVNHILHNLIHLKDTLHTIGQPVTVERYFNIQNGEVLEVDKEHFIGLPDDENESQSN